MDSKTPPKIDLVYVIIVDFKLNLSRFILCSPTDETCDCR